MNIDAVSGLFVMIFHIIAVSIPEALFAVVFCLILLGHLEYLKINRHNIVRILVPTVVSALVSTILRIIIPSSTDYMPFIGIGIVSGLISLIYGPGKFIQVLKVFICTTFSFITMALCQFFYIPVLLFGSNVPIELLNKPGIAVFIWSLPEKALEIGLIALLLAKNASFLKINFFKTIVESRLLTIITIVVFTFNIVFFAFMMYLLGTEKILYGLPLYTQILAIVVTLLLPIVNLFTLFVAIYHVKSREIKKRFDIQEEIRVSISDIDFFLKRGEYQRIKEELQYLIKDTNELYDDKN